MENNNNDDIIKIFNEDIAEEDEEKVTPCNFCYSEGKDKCKTCNGKGLDDEDFSCYNCKGSGEVECYWCDGKGESKKIKIEF